MFKVGTLSSVVAAPAIEVGSNFNVQLSGTFVATVVLERSFDGGTTFVPVSKNVDGAAASYTAPMSLSVFEPKSGAATPTEPNVQYRFNCIAYTSGTINWRISD